VVVEQLLGRSEQSLVLERGSEQRRQGGRPKKCSAVVCVKPGLERELPVPHLADAAVGRMCRTTAPRSLRTSPASGRAGRRPRADPSTRPRPR
jgi:hypothetical protein